MVNQYVITAVNGGMIGSVPSVTDAYETMKSLRFSWPHKHYVCHTWVDGRELEVLNTRNF